MDQWASLGQRIEDVRYWGQWYWRMPELNSLVCVVSWSMEHICCAFSSTIKSHIAFDPRPHPFPSVPYSSLWLVSMVPVVSSASDTQRISCLVYPQRWRCKRHGVIYPRHLPMSYKQISSVVHLHRIRLVIVFCCCCCCWWWIYDDRLLFLWYWI